MTALRDGSDGVTVGVPVAAAPEALTIGGARVVDPFTGIDRVVDVHLGGGRIVAVGPAPAGFRALY